MSGPKAMSGPKEPGGWQDAGATAPEVPEQPKGTPDRTPGAREAFPRDVDEGLGRHAGKDKDFPAGKVPASPR